MPLTKLHTVTNYEATLAEFIKNNEGFEPEVYLDSKGIATIGIGYALNKSINIISADFAKAGIPLTETQKTVLDNWYKNNNGKPSQSDVNAFNANANTIILSETQGKNLFIAIKGQYEDIVKSKLGTMLYNSMANTKELIALVDMAYNSPSLIGNNLVAAITNGDRVAAWYEIRYNSNKERSNGLQNRRARESDMFGLYSGEVNTPSNDNEAKQVIRFLEEKRGTIATYLSQIPNIGISDLNNALSPAKNLLISEYSQGVNIDGQILIGQGIGNAGESFADVSAGNDTLSGTTKNDLIFGERGSDTLSGGAGSDVLYGGEGNDTIAGNNGSDYIDGGVGADTLMGEAGKDIILGGAGEDTVNGGSDADVLLGDNDSDVLYGGEGQDTLIGGDNDNASDALFGGSAEDVLLGGGGDDTLAGGDASNLYADKELDYLAGGVGHDIYYVSHQDIINDADSTGFIMFNDKSLSGTKTKVDENTYEDANFTYTLDGSNLIVVDKNLGEYITIENFQNSAMGITLDNGNGNGNNSKKDIELYVGDATVTEGGTLEFTIGINNTLNKDLVVNVSTYFNGSANSSDLSGTTNGTITIKAGTTYGIFEIATLDDTTVEPTENFIFAVTGLAKAYDEILINNNLHVDMKEVA